MNTSFPEQFFHPLSSLAKSSAMLRQRNRLSNSTSCDLETRAMLAASLTNEGISDAVSDTQDTGKLTDSGESVDSSPATSESTESSERRDRRDQRRPRTNSDTSASNLGEGDAAPVSTATDSEPEVAGPPLSEVGPETLTSDVAATDPSLEPATGQVGQETPTGSVTESQTPAQDLSADGAVPVNSEIDATTPEDAAATRSNGDQFSLVWSDEFNTLDADRWYLQNNDTRDPPGNYRTSDGENRFILRRWRDENVSVDEERGVLQVKTLRTQGENDKGPVLAGAKAISRDAFKPSDAESGEIHIESRVRFSRPKGAHTAFWLTGENGLNRGSDDLTGADGAEIDIYESNNNLKFYNPNKDGEFTVGEDGRRYLEDGREVQSHGRFDPVLDADGNAVLDANGKPVTELNFYDWVQQTDRVRAGFHWNAYDGPTARSSHVVKPVGDDGDIYEEWANVGITWSHDRIQFLWNGVPYHTTSNPNVISQVASKINFSSQVTDPGFGGILADSLGELDDDLGLEVDWVRVFHRNSEDPVSSEPNSKQPAAEPTELA